MKNKKINISENIGIVDSKDMTRSSSGVTGIITIYDENGNIICHTHNMVVKTGRSMMFKAFVKAFGNVTDNIDISNYLFNNVGLAYCTDSTVTYPSMEYSNITGSGNIELPLTASVVSGDNTTEGISYNLDELSIEIKKTITPTILLDATGVSSGKINMIYTFFENSGTKILFSRALIDPIFLSSSTTYTLVYKFYF